jgi:hypothetical protein
MWVFLFINPIFIIMEKNILSEREIQNLVSQTINEMGPKDWRVKEILKMWDEDPSIEMRSLLSTLVSMKRHDSRERLESDLLDTSHEDLSDISDELGLV